MTPEDPAHQSLRDDLPGVERLLTLSDGVVAIAMTLLVLQVTVPHLTVHRDEAWALADKLGQSGSEFVSYGISFYVIAQFWLAHHRVFRHVAGHQEGLAWWNFAFLFTITLMPFTSALLGAYPDNPLAVDLLAANLMLASLSTQFVILYGRRRGLLRPGTRPETLRAGHVRALSVVVVVAVSAGVAWWSTDVAKLMWISLAFVPELVMRAIDRRERKGATPTRRADVSSP